MDSHELSVMGIKVPDPNLGFGSAVQTLSKVNKGASRNKVKMREIREQLAITLERTGSLKNT